MTNNQTLTHHKVDAVDGTLPQHIMHFIHAVAEQIGAVYLEDLITEPEPNDGRRGVVNDQADEDAIVYGTDTNTNLVLFVFAQSQLKQEMITVILIIIVCFTVHLHSHFNMFRKNRSGGETNMRGLDSLSVDLLHC